MQQQQTSLAMHTPNLADENFRRLAALFPNAVTESVNEAGEVVRAIDADVLRQEISAAVVEGPQERYQFTWPDKKRAIALANQPIAKTLRLDRARSVGRDGTLGSIDTENLYIEGDNLDALKLLRETYLGKVKVIYIDPPYNTGADFIYKDDFAQGRDEYLAGSGQFDEEGNRLVQNTESNGRFHTDWLNMMYPRLHLAKDLMADEGVIFISIDDSEQENLKKICNEIFGAQNFISQICIVTGANQSGDGVLIQKNVESCLCFAKNICAASIFRVDKTEEIYRNLNDAPTPLSTRLDMGYTIYYNPSSGDMIPVFDYDKRSVEKNIESAVYFDRKDLIADGYVPVRPGKRNGKLHRWRWGLDKFLKRKHEIKIFEIDGRLVPKFQQHGFNAPKNIWSYTVGTNDLKKLFGDNMPFDYSKGVAFLSYICSIGLSEDDVVLDFFSGSATTAQAVMQFNAEDGGRRRFILVQLPEFIDPKKATSDKAKKVTQNAVAVLDSIQAEHTIFEIGRERIRRAGKKIREETGADIDYGFRVLRVDSTNMEDVYYRPQDYEQQALPQMADNVKPDRTAEDLLIQVMLELGVPLSSAIAEEKIAGKRVFSVADGYLLACFDAEVTDEVVTAIARRRPFYAVLRDSGLASDSVAVNFEQIFAALSPQTRRKVL